MRDDRDREPQREPLPKGCAACHFTGWLSWPLVNEAGKNIPHAGACCCPLGAYLASEREGTKQIPNPVVVKQVPREVYNAAWIKAREIAEPRTRSEAA